MKEKESVFANEMITEIKKAKFQPHAVLQILLFILVFMGASIIQTIGMMPAMLEGGIEAAANPELLMQKDSFMLLSLWICIVEILVPILYCVCIEKRSALSMGFQKKKWIRSYAKGLLIGTFLIIATWAMGYVAGVYHYETLANIQIVAVLFYAIGFIIQSMGEEVMVRGYFMNSLTNKVGSWGAILISSLVFSLLHLVNAGFNIYAFLDIFLIGIFLGMYVLKTGNIWGASAIHFAWNFIQGVILGIPVSGIPIGASIWKLGAIQENGNIWVDKVFGIEGSLASVMVIAIACIVLFSIIMRKKKK